MDNIEETETLNLEENNNQNEETFDYSYLEIIEQNQTDLNESIQKTNLILEVFLCFIIFFVLVILLKYAYKFFDMLFK